MQRFKRRLATAVMGACVTWALGACGGGGGSAPLQQAQDAPVQMVQTAQLPQAASTPNLVQLLSTRQLLAWAEQAYPTIFPMAVYPSNQVNRYSEAYTYRAYPTGNYLATAGQSVYLLCPASGNVLSYLGTLSQFSCRINIAQCHASAPAAAPVFINDWAHSEIAVLQGTPAGGAAVPVNLFSVGALISDNSVYDAGNDSLQFLTIGSDQRVRVQTVDRASAATGAVTPSRSIETNLTATTGISMFLDRASDTLYVGGNTSDRNIAGGYIAAFSNFSAAGSAITATRVVTFPSLSLTAFTVDVGRSIAYVTVYDKLLAVPNIRTASGPVTINSVTTSGDGNGPPVCSATGATCLLVTATGLAIDAARDRLYAADPVSGQLYIMSNASAMGYTIQSIPIQSIRSVSYDARNDRLYAGATYQAYILNAASTLTRSLDTPSTALTLQGTLGMGMMGFAFP